MQHELRRLRHFERRAPHLQSGAHEQHLQPLRQLVSDGFPRDLADHEHQLRGLWRFERDAGDLRAELVSRISAAFRTRAERRHYGKTSSSCPFVSSPSARRSHSMAAPVLTALGSVRFTWEADS